MQIIVNDLLVHYELQGKGKAVLLLHGWGDRAAGLAVVQQALAKQYKVLSLDLPGFGSTQAPAEIWNLDDYATFVQLLLDKLKIKDLYAVIGHSNGGALAIRAIRLKKLQPQKLVLLAASGIRTRNSLRRIMLNITAKAGNLATLWMPQRYRRALRESLYQAAGSDMLVVPHLQETFKKTVRQDVQKDAEELKLPTLLIYADNDDAVPLADGQLYSRLIENSHLKVVTGAGHFIHLDRPEKVNKLIMDFLK